MKMRKILPILLVALISPICLVSVCVADAVLRNDTISGFSTESSLTPDATVKILKIWYWDNGVKHAVDLTAPDPVISLPDGQHVISFEVKAVYKGPSGT